MTKRTKALDISKSVKDAVWERDSGMCIFCTSHNAAPSCHFISRAQGGLGIEQNVVTACLDCHRAYDQSTQRPFMREYIREYLMSCYPDWDESKLIYRKGFAVHKA